MTGADIDTTRRPRWLATGHLRFCYAALVDSRWWVLRLNNFPEHDMWTLFVDGEATVDVTASPDSPIPLVKSIARLRIGETSGTDTLNPVTAKEVLAQVEQYRDYGSEKGEPCPWCSLD